MERDVDQRQLTSDQVHETEQAPTVVHLTNLFLQSFRHSQGYARTQAQILQYVHCLHPDWRISDHLRAQIRRKSLPAIAALVSQMDEADQSRPRLHKAFAYEIIELETDIQLKRLQKELNKSIKHPKRKLKRLVPLIAQGIIDRDCDYFVRGRPKGGNMTSRNPHADPQLSHYCYYGLEANSTGLPELDQMYRDIVAVVKAGKVSISRRFDFSLNEMVATYYKRHSQG